MIDDAQLNYSSAIHIMAEVLKMHLLKTKVDTENIEEKDTRLSA